MREFVVAGLLVPPFVKYALFAALVFVPARPVLACLDFQKWFWHPLVAEAAVYVCILATLDIPVRGPATLDRARRAIRVSLTSLLPAAFVADAMRR